MSRAVLLFVTLLALVGCGPTRPTPVPPPSPVPTIDGRVRAEAEDLAQYEGGATLQYARLVGRCENISCLRRYEKQLQNEPLALSLGTTLYATNPATKDAELACEALQKAKALVDARTQEAEDYVTWAHLEAASQ